MANGLFDDGREGFLDGSIDWDTDTIKAVLVDHGVDTPVKATDKFLSDIAAGARISTSPAFGSKTVTDGVADAADPTFTAVSGASVESIVIFKDTGTDTTSRLIAMIDGKITVKVAKAAALNDITLTVDPLEAALPNGTQLVYGAVTATLNVAAAAGARTLNVNALSGAIAVDATAEGATSSGLPVTPNGMDIVIQWDNGGNKIFKL